MDFCFHSKGTLLFGLTWYVWIFSASIILAEPPAIDSLKSLISDELSERELIEIYTELAFEYTNLDSTQTAYYANKAIELAQKIDYPQGSIEALIHWAWTTLRIGNYPEAEEMFKQALFDSENINYKKGQAQAYNGLGTCYAERGDYDVALKHHQNSLALMQEIGDEDGTALAYNNLSSVYYYKGLYAETLKNLLKALKLREDLNDRRGEAAVLGNISLVYDILDENDKAIEMLERSLPLYEQLGNTRGLALNNLNLASLYLEKGQKEKARLSNEIALNLFTSTDNVRGMSFAMSGLASLYESEGDFQKALELYEKVLILRQGANDRSGIASSLIDMGQANIKLNDHLKALDYLHKGLDMASEIGNSENILSAYESLASVYGMVQEYQQAYKYHVLFKTLEDSLNSEENSRSIGRVEAEYAFQNERDSLRYAQEKLSFQMNEELSRQRLIQRGAIVGLISVMIFAFVIFRYYQLKKKANQELAESNAEIQAQNEEIIQQRDQLAEKNEYVEAQREKLKDANNRLMALDEEKNMLMGVVAHDLKSPINQISGLLEITKRSLRKDQRDIHQYMDKIHESAEYAREMITRILNENATDSADLKLDISETNIYSLVEKCVYDFRIEAEKKHIKVNIEHDQGSFIGLVDKNYFLQVVQNLISNAIKFSPFKSLVKVKVEHAEDRIRTSVIDQGPGLSEEDKKKLFRKYQKLSARPTAGESSTGLGLVIAKKFIEAMNGTIWYRSEQGKGSSFMVEVPTVIPK